MSEELQYLPRNGYTSMPWRNGAGVTREIVRVPAHGEPFAWRLSLASIAASGPFSAYPQCQRIVGLVEGRGFRLDIQNAQARVLAACGDYAVFPGAAQTHCTLIDGPCTDLSLMVREPGKTGPVMRLRIADRELPVASVGTIQIVFVLRGSVTYRAQSHAPPGAAAAPVSSLHVNDTLIIYGARTTAFRSQTPDEESELLLLTFTPHTDGTE